MPRVVHFEIHAQEPTRALAFYGGVFGWTAQQWGANPYWLLSSGQDGPGIDGAMILRRGPPPVDGAPVNAFVCSVDVPDCDATVAKVLAHGGVVAVPKMALPGVGWVAYVKDTEGNLLGVYQYDTTAR